MPSRPALRDAMLTVFKTQELAGVDVVTDGELSRFDVNHPETQGMIEYFVSPLAGVDTSFSRDDVTAFRQQSGMQFRKKPAGVVRDAIGEGTLDLPSAASGAALTTKPYKFTVTSPYMLAKSLLDLHYRDIRQLAFAIAEVFRAQAADIDASVLQIDEANLVGAPQDGEWAADVLNRVFAGFGGQKAVHLCFGNYGGQTIQQGLFRDLLPFFNRLECDHLILEFARPGDAELPVFTELRPEIELGIGVVDIKDNAVESPDLIARRIERTVDVLGADRIKWVHPDCGFWMLSRIVADQKMAALVQGRDLYLGQKSE
jgi:5-methyltetrahydropteroyltriglutamate--homocysteine methyltransferase